MTHSWTCIDVVVKDIDCSCRVSSLKAILSLLPLYLEWSPNLSFRLGSSFCLPRWRKMSPSCVINGCGQWFCKITTCSCWSFLDRTSWEFALDVQRWAWRWTLASHSTSATSPSDVSFLRLEKYHGSYVILIHSISFTQTILRVLGRILLVQNAGSAAQGRGSRRLFPSHEAVGTEMNTFLKIDTKYNTNMKH